MHLNGHSSLEDIEAEHKRLDREIDRIQHSPRSLIAVGEQRLRDMKRKRCRLKTMILARQPEHEVRV